MNLYLLAAANLAKEHPGAAFAAFTGTAIACRLWAIAGRPDKRREMQLLFPVLVVLSIACVLLTPWSMFRPH